MSTKRCSVRDNVAVKSSMGTTLADSEDALVRSSKQQTTAAEKKLQKLKKKNKREVAEVEAVPAIEEPTARG